MKWELSSSRQTFVRVQRQAVFADFMLSRNQIVSKAVDTHSSFFGSINYEGGIRINVLRLPQSSYIINITVLFFNVPDIRDIVLYFTIRSLFGNNRLMSMFHKTYACFKAFAVKLNSRFSSHIIPGFRLMARGMDPANSTLFMV
jgi:hypothetical protein